MEIKSLGLEEVVADEAININGGIVPVAAAVAEYLCALIAGALVGYLAHRALDVEEVYGGELDPAICEG